MALTLFNDFLKQHERYLDDRRGIVPQNIRHRRPGIAQPAWGPQGPVANITWKDAAIVWPHIMKVVDPTESQLRSLTRAYLKGTPGARWAGEGAAYAKMRALYSSFERTPAFMRAKDDFEQMRPDQLAGGAVNLVGHIMDGDRFPRAEEFWGYALRLVNEREGAGTRPPWIDIAFESVGEAISELPETLRDSATAAFNATKNLIPSAGRIADAIWLAIYAVGAYVTFRIVRG